MMPPTGRSGDLGWPAVEGPDVRMPEREARPRR